MKTPFEVVKSRLCQEWSISETDGIVVAVSGGADSMALLHILCQLRETLSFSLVAAHVNHGLRGQESDRDAAFVVDTCAKWCVPLETLSVNLSEEALPGEGIEMAGRRIRYGFFEQLRQHYGYRYIATAHHGDDNLETVLLHLARGCGVRGLCGISPCDNGILRPLLTCTRESIEQYCRDENIAFVTDSTNEETVYTRNQVRWQVIPTLKEINPQVVEACSRLTAHLREEDAFLEQLTGALLENARVDDVKFDRAVLLDSSPVLYKRALKQIIMQLGVDPQEKYIQLAEKALREGNGGVQLSDTAFLTVDNCCLKAENKPFISEMPYFEFSVQPGDTQIVDGVAYAVRCVTVNEYENVYKKDVKFACDYDKLCGNIVMRQRKPGDAFHPVGGVGKTLKKYFNENAVPVEQRARVPILCDEQGVVLITGYSCDERVKLDKCTKRVLVVTGGKSCEYT